jgi:hypothetical protein
MEYAIDKSATEQLIEATEQMPEATESIEPKKWQRTTKEERNRRKLGWFVNVKGNGAEKQKAAETKAARKAAIHGAKKKL